MKTFTQICALLTKHGWQQIGGIYFGGYSTCHFKHPKKHNGYKLSVVKADGWKFTITGLVRN